MFPERENLNPKHQLNIYILSFFFFLQQDRISSLEHNLTVSQSENSKLTQKLEATINSVNETLRRGSPTKVAELELENNQLKERLLLLETDKLKLQKVFFYIWNYCFFKPHRSPPHPPSLTLDGVPFAYFPMYCQFELTYTCHLPPLVSMFIYN